VCKEATIRLLPKISAAADAFMDNNLGCLSQCNEEVAQACTADCITGLRQFSAACTPAGGRIFVVAERAFFAAPGNPEFTTNVYQCLPTQCDNRDDELAYDAFFQLALCKHAGGAPVKECFVEVTTFAALPDSCQNPLTAMRASQAYTKAVAAYRAANTECFAGCGAKSTASCTATCNSGANDLQAACQAAGTELMTLERKIELSSGGGTSLVRFGDCAPTACLSGPVRSEFQEDATAAVCDEYSATDVKTCSVTIVPGGLGPDGVEVTGIVFAVLGGIALLGFAGYHLVTRTGVVPRSSFPSFVANALECGCCPRCGSGAASGHTKLPSGSSAVGSSSGVGGYSSFQAGSA